jgi:translocation and assembly module TamB
VSGQAELNVTAVGTSHEPRFTGVVALSNAGFVVTSTGARYQDGNGIIDLTADRITVRDFRIADSGGRVLDVSGSVGASDLKLQDLALEIAARGFEILRNEYGTINADARVAFRGRVESPEVSGTITITGGQLRADRILDRVLFQPYGLEEADGSSRPVDAIAALNPWDRLSLDVSVDVPGTLRLTGDNVQVASGTPLGVGNIDLRVAGAVHLRKGPGETLSVTGALDQITGRYAFQGRRFDLDPSSSITFRGDLEPDLQVTVHRLISGVDVRVAISGALSDPALELTSAPPLDSSDILSLIVFNTTANQLSVAQQEQLAVRAGTLAAGFLAAPLVTALERSLGIDLLEIEAADTGGARVTIGDEIAPGLVARFSRQFGSDEYDEATLEYYLSRLFRIRATFSDAGSAIRSPFRRVERAGVDLLLFFSF